MIPGAIAVVMVGVGWAMIVAASLWIGLCAVLWALDGWER